ncbi:MAG: MBL fold metallo-hydrolase [Desulfovibrio sp.]|nr:MBL fold metallo-hydrolase [Desulfovibrio sp.]
MKKWSRRALLGGLAALAGAAGAGALFLQSPRFGAAPEGERLARVQASPHWADGAFRNLEPTPLITSGEGVVKAWAKFLFKPKGRTEPKDAIPCAKTDLRALDPAKSLAVWLGHSSVFLHLAGMRILVDPVFSSHAAPLPAAVAAFRGTGVYGPGDMPDIDLLLISHDHWDHLDYPTVCALAPRVRRVLCPLGVGAHLVRFGLPESRLVELDWFGQACFGPVSATLTPSRHFSGRLLARDRTLWGGFALEGAGLRICFTGDGGYGSHFREIGRRFGGFDLVMPDTGQYNRRWAHVHMFPEEAARACADLGGRALLPVHAGRFCISEHDWDDPFRRISRAAEGMPWRLATPLIGEPVEIAGSLPQRRWWEGLA